MAQQRYDAIVLGGGHNGLVTAAYLARAGLRPLLLERREVLGGCAVTEEIWPGFRVSTAAYLVSLLQPRVIKELELERFGYQVDPKDPAFFSAYPDGRYLFFWQDERRTLEEIAKFSRRDAERFPAYEAHIERLARLIEPLLFVTPPQFPPARAADWIEYLKLLARFRGVDRRDIVSLVKLFTQSAADFLDEWFESDQLKVTLATDAVIGANGGPRSPGTAYILLHHVMGGVGGKRGLWGFVRGGVGAIAEALAASARSRGAEIRTASPVDRILVRNGAVEGVVLEGGHEIRARVVASSLDPHQTFLRRIDPAALPPEFLEAVRRIRIEGTSAKINLALAGLPEFRAFGATPGPHHRATMHICPSMDYVEQAWDDAKYGRPSRRPMLELTIPTMYDASLAPPGRHIMGIFLQYAPYTLREGSWEELREPFYEQVLAVMEEYIPNIRSIILERQVLTPLDLERRFGISRGNIFHGEMSLDQMFFLRPVAGWAGYRTPVRGLYLCGSGAHPGGGILGAPGYNAAREILRDLKRPG